MTRLACRLLVLVALLAPAPVSAQSLRVVSWNTANGQNGQEQHSDIRAALLKLTATMPWMSGTAATSAASGPASACLAPHCGQNREPVRMFPPHSRQ